MREAIAIILLIAVTKIKISPEPFRIVATAYRLTSTQESAHNLIIK
jgi:hypothetical protein